MWPSFSAPVALFGSFAVSLLLALPAPAQVNGPPASVTSPGFGGNAVNGPRSSVTSLGPQGYNPPTHHPFTTGNGNHQGDRDGHRGGGDGDRDGRRHHNNNDVTGPIWYAVPVPYGVENPPAEEQPEDEAEYQGGPTVFDRRGSGERSYVPPAKDAPAAHAPMHAPERDDAPAVEPDPPLPTTVLVFKDGHKMEVQNYAIQGSTLFDLTPGHKRKIPIAELDVVATRKQNDEHGVTFELPLSTKVN